MSALEPPKNPLRKRASTGALREDGKSRKKACAMTEEGNTHDETAGEEAGIPSPSRAEVAAEAREDHRKAEHTGASGKSVAIAPGMDMSAMRVEIEKIMRGWHRFEK